MATTTTPSSSQYPDTYNVVPPPPPELMATQSGSSFPGQLPLDRDYNLLYDPEICTALGMTMETGMCLRHPNICIFLDSPSPDTNVRTCKICDSETKAGGIRQRKSFAFAIHQIQEIHGTPQWQHFKDAWGAEEAVETTTGGGSGQLVSLSEEKKGEGTTPPTSIVLDAGRHQAIELQMRPSETALIKQNKFKWTKATLKRAAQVAAWKTAHQAAEMELLQKQMDTLEENMSKEQEVAKERESALKDVAATRESELQEVARARESELQAKIDEQTKQLEELTKRCEKQEQHINKELRVIKTIALKRASSRGSVGGSNRNVNASNNSNSSSGTNTPNSAANGEGDMPMKQPYRKASDAPDKVAAAQAHLNGSRRSSASSSSSLPSPGGGANMTKNIDDIQSPTSHQSDILSPESIKSAPGGGNNRMSGRQSQRLSSLTLTDASAFHQGANSATLPLNDTYDFDQDKSPNQPQRLPSQDTGVTTLSDLTTSLAPGPLVGRGEWMEAGANAHSIQVGGCKELGGCSNKDFGRVDIHQMTPSTILSPGSNSSSLKHHQQREITPAIQEEIEEDSEESSRRDRVPSKLIAEIATAGTDQKPSSRRQYRNDVAARNTSHNSHGDRRTKSDTTGGSANNIEFSGFHVDGGSDRDQPSNNRSRSPPQPRGGGHIRTNSDTKEFNAGAFRSPATTKPRSPGRVGRSKSTEEISFIPTQSETNSVQPPPPPPPPDISNALSPSMNRSQEIEFDVSRDIQTEGVDKRRKSLMGMKFDTSQRLLMEASAALADPTMTPTLPSTRKTVSQSPAVAKHKQQHQQTSKRNISLTMSQVMAGTPSAPPRHAQSASAHNRDIDLGNSHAALSGVVEKNPDSYSLKNKTEEEIFNERIFGKIEKATPENEADDEYDYFASLPSDLGLTSEGYLRVRESCNLSPVSAITTGSMSYLLDHQPGGYSHGGDDDGDDDDDGPRKGLHQAGDVKRLPMEEDFDSDDDETGPTRGASMGDGDEEDSDSTGLGASARDRINDVIGDTISYDDDDDYAQEKEDGVDGDNRGAGGPPPQEMKSSAPGRQPQPQREISLQPDDKQPSIVKPKAQRASPPGSGDNMAQRRTLSEGFNKPTNTNPGSSGHSRSLKTRATIQVEEEIVHDKYGDGGIYTGMIAAQDRLPHGNGRMAYDNERQYDGEWRKGRWHGIGKWVNPNGDCYEGTFVYDARQGRGTYTWKNGNVYKGDFHEDKRQGKGIFNFANGNVYEGDFINGVFEGQGRYRFEGGFYEGGWKGGRYHNHGYLKFADGSSYTGEFVDGVAHGKGEETAADGTVRAGYWENGRPISSGTSLP